MKFHFLGSLVLAVLIAFTAISGSRTIRLAFAALSIIVFYAVFIIYGIEYDRLAMEQWKAKEKRLRKELLKGK